MIPDADALLGRLAGPYRLDRQLGQGGFSWVFAGHRTATGEPVATKVLKPRYAGDQQLERRFRHEAEVASRLAHPHIVRIHELGTEGHVVYFGLHLYRDSLGPVLAREAPLLEARLLTIALHITDALCYAHAQQVIHRDIKVDNILLAADGTAVLTDFGIARAATGTTMATGAKMTIGTPHYISPEQAQGRPLAGWWCSTPWFRARLAANCAGDGSSGSTARSQARIARPSSPSITRPSSRA